MLLRKLTRNFRTSSQIKRKGQTVINKTHYDILGVAQNASQNDIKTAYYKLSKLYHPDKSNTQSSKEFVDITLAYKVLGNNKTKKSYDEMLSHLGLTSETFSVPPFYKLKNVKEHKMPNTDKIPIYDFDEWNKFHYSQNMARRREARHRYHQKVNTDSDIIVKQNRNVFHFVLSVTISLLSFIMFKSMLFGSRPNDYDNKRSKT